MSDDRSEDWEGGDGQYDGAEAQEPFNALEGDEGGVPVAPPPPDATKGGSAEGTSGASSGQTWTTHVHPTHVSVSDTSVCTHPCPRAAVRKLHFSTSLSSCNVVSCRPLVCCMSVCTRTCLPCSRTHTHDALYFVSPYTSTLYR